jgi:hypothetical protein
MKKSSWETNKNSYKVQQTILKEWPSKTDWLKADKGNKTTFRFDELPFFYMDAQRILFTSINWHNQHINGYLLGTAVVFDEKIILGNKLAVAQGNL